MTRIPQSDGYTRLLSKRPKAKTRRLQCFALPNEGLGARLGVLVPKRWARRAVDRHALKRLIREAHRQWVLPHNEHVDLLVRLCAPVRSVGPSDRNQWWEELRQLLEQRPGRL